MLLFRKEVRYNAVAAMIALIIKMEVAAILFCDGGEKMESRARVLCPIAGNEMEAPPPPRR